MNKTDNWKHRSEGMLCRTCMYSVDKGRSSMMVGRCRRHAPTMNGWPVTFQSDWCGDHKLDETKLIHTMAEKVPVSKANEEKIYIRKDTYVNGDSVGESV